MYKTTIAGEEMMDDVCVGVHFLCGKVRHVWRRSDLIIK